MMDMMEFVILKTVYCRTNHHKMAVQSPAAS